MSLTLSMRIPRSRMSGNEPHWDSSPVEFQQRPCSVALSRLACPSGGTGTATLPPKQVDMAARQAHVTTTVSVHHVSVPAIDVWEVDTAVGFSTWSTPIQSSHAGRNKHCMNLDDALLVSNVITAL
jgi:hypothetical protein